MESQRSPSLQCSTPLPWMLLTFQMRTTSFLSQRTWTSKLVRQGYDEAVVFAGKHNGVQARIQTRAAHSVYIHCVCHRLQLASIQAANSIPEVNKMLERWEIYGSSSSTHSKRLNFSRKSSPSSSYQSLKLWGLVIPRGSHMNTPLSPHYSICMRYQVMLNHTVSALSLPHTLGWLESCFCLKFWIFSQKWMDPCKGSLLISASYLCFWKSQLINLCIWIKMNVSGWVHWSTEITLLKDKHNITLGTHGFPRSHWSSITATAEYRTLVAIPYVDALLENIKSRFTDKAVKIVTAMSIFNPSLLPSEDSLPSYGTRYLLSYMEKKQRSVCWHLISIASWWWAPSRVEDT